MSEQNFRKQVSVGIIGGGHGGLEMLKVFTGCASVRVSYVVDRDKHAPAIIMAKKRDIETTDDLQEALMKHDPDFIIEATGVPAVEKLVKEGLGDGTELISSRAALLFFNVLDENRKKASQETFTQIRKIGEDIAASAKSVQGTLNGINEVAFSLDMLSVNASVEAARAGASGRSFAVVADAVKETAKEAKVLVADIEEVTSNNMRMSQQLKDLLADLG